MDDLTIISKLILQAMVERGMCSPDGKGWWTIGWAMVNEIEQGTSNAMPPWIWAQREANVLLAIYGIQIKEVLETLVHKKEE